MGLPTGLIVRPLRVDGAARKAELADAIAASARAFYDDPLFNFFQPSFIDQLHRLPGFFGSMAHDIAAHGEVWVAANDRVRAVAMWYPPGEGPPASGWRMVQQMRRAAPALLKTGRRLKAAVELLNEMPKHHPDGPHWHLQILAVDPMLQKRGLGGALLDPILAKCDTEGLPAYLETQKEENLAYYGRFRFSVTEVLRVKRCPPIWTMTRPPR